ncbi:unnamed protein product [Rhizophagus irregularis]|nr:unnamed protein product [Rhizophagus irregularis]
MEISLFAIKTNVWKFRSRAWKQWKNQHGITKKGFTQYRRTTPPDRLNNSCTVPRSFISHIYYIYPQTTSFRKYYNRADLMFIILASSNFLHSGSILQQMTNGLSVNVSTFSFPHTVHTT